MNAQRGVGRIALSALFFGSLAVLARTLSGQVPFAQLVLIRFVVGALGALAWFVALRRRPTLASPWLLAARGFFGGGAVLAYFFAIETLGAAPATVLNYCSPIYAALWASLFLKERSTPLMKVGLLMASAGAILVTASTGSLAQPMHPALGAVAGIASGVLGGAALTALKAARETVDAVTVFLVFCLVGAVMAAPLVVGVWVPLTAVQWLKAIGVGVLALVAQLLLTSGMGHTSAMVGSATTQLAPVVAWVLSIMFLDDPVAGLAIAGAALCLAGVLAGVVRWQGGPPHVGAGDPPETETRRGA